MRTGTSRASVRAFARIRTQDLRNGTCIHQRLGHGFHAGCEAFQGDVVTSQRLIVCLYRLEPSFKRRVPISEVLLGFLRMLVVSLYSFEIILQLSNHRLVVELRLVEVGNLPLHRLDRRSLLGYISCQYVDLLLQIADPASEI